MLDGGWDGEDVLPVRHGIDDVLTQEFAELNDLLGMARWTEPTATAGEGEQELMAAVRAADAGKAMGEVTALEIIVDYLGDDGAEKAIVLDESLSSST